MAASGSRRRVAPGSAPRPRPRRRNARLGTPKSAGPRAVCAAPRLRLGPNGRLRLTRRGRSAPVPPEDVTPAMRAGLVTACEGVVAALAAPPRPPAWTRRSASGPDAVRRTRDSDAPLPAPTLEPRSRAETESARVAPDRVDDPLRASDARCHPRERGRVSGTGRRCPLLTTKALRARTKKHPGRVGGKTESALRRRDGGCSSSPAPACSSSSSRWRGRGATGARGGP